MRETKPQGEGEQRGRDNNHEPLDLAKQSIRIIPEHRIDMSAERCVDGENARLVQHLKDFYLYREGLGYTVVHPNLLDVVREVGTYRLKKDGEPKKSVFCLRAAKDTYGEESLVDSSADLSWSDYISFGSDAAKTGIPIVVYDMDKLVEVNTDEFKFTCERKLDAVVAIVILETY
jgi:hypothetical protein